MTETVMVTEALTVAAAESAGARGRRAGAACWGAAVGSGAWGRVFVFLAACTRGRTHHMAGCHLPTATQR